MNFRNLEYFIAITKENNISKAADRLHVSQQSLSEQLKKLESEVGVPLVNRGNPISLTQAGEVFLRESEKILETYNGMMDEIAEMYELSKTKITLAIPSTEMPLFLPELLTKFAVEHPEITVRIVKCEPKEAAKSAGDFDLYVSTLPLGDDLEHIAIKENETYAVAFSKLLADKVYGSKWPRIEAELLEKRNIYTVRELPFVFLCNRMDEIVLDQQIIFKEAGIAPKIAFMSDNSELNASMCMCGNGAYVATLGYCMRRFQDGSEKNDNMLFYPVDTAIDPVMTALSYRKGKKLTKAEKCFVEAAKSFLAD